MPSANYAYLHVVSALEFPSIHIQVEKFLLNIKNHTDGVQFVSNSSTVKSSVWSYYKTLSSCRRHTGINNVAGFELSLQKTSLHNNRKQSYKNRRYVLLGVVFSS